MTISRVFQFSQADLRSRSPSVAVTWCFGQEHLRAAAFIPATMRLPPFILEHILAGILVAAATTCQESPPGTSIPLAWRVRGMATLPEYHDMALAGQLLARCLTSYPREQGHTRMVQFSRVATVSFYQQHGFVSVGEPFFLPHFSDESYILMEQGLVA